MKKFTLKNLFILLSAITILLPATASAQTRSKSVKKAIKKAEALFGEGNYNAAANIYTRLLKKDSKNPELNFKTGLCNFYSSTNKGKAVKYFENTLAAGDSMPEVLYYLGSLYHLENRFDEAIGAYRAVLNFTRKNKKGFKLKSEIDLRIQMCFNAKNILVNPLNVDIENIGFELNSTYDDFAPVVKADEKSIYFSSRRKGNTGGFENEDGSFAEDIYCSISGEDGKWKKSKRASSHLNSEDPETVLAFSPDGKSMLIGKGGDIYISLQSEKKWSKPVKLNNSINSTAAENAASFSEGGNVIYFSSNRKDGFGGTDIYISEKINGDWGPALNLGPIINSPYDEDYPFFQENSKTIYFSSRREDSVGGFDVFSSRQIDGAWEIPANYGYPINTSSDEIYFSVNSEGTGGYFASSRTGGRGNLDIYEFTYKTRYIPLSTLKPLP